MLLIDFEQNTYASEISGANSVSLSLAAFVTEPEGSAKKWSNAKTHCGTKVDCKQHIY